MALSVHQLAERPDLEASMLEIGDLGVWPEFMLWDATAGLYFGHLDWWSEYVLVAVDDDPSVVVGRAFSIPFAIDGKAQGRRDLPDGGWDRVVQWGHADKEDGRPPTHVSALEITMRPDRLGRGSSASMVTAMRDNARRLGFRELVAPVRPNRKHEHPHMAMAEYIGRRRSDGLPDDPWLRVHVRLGAEIVKIAPSAMTITGTLEEWRGWTGLPFDVDGDVVVPGALVPVHVSVRHDHAVYVEPNVWMRHPL